MKPLKHPRFYIRILKRKCQRKLFFDLMTIYVLVMFLKREGNMQNCIALLKNSYRVSVPSYSCRTFGRFLKKNKHTFDVQLKSMKGKTKISLLTHYRFHSKSHRNENHSEVTRNTSHNFSNVIIRVPSSLLQ